MGDALIDDFSAPGKVGSSAVVPASADDVFEFIRRPANHPLIAGDNSVLGVRTGPEVLGLGDKFGMKMKIGIPYNISSQVVEFEADRCIAWALWGGHRWRWEMQPVDEQSCRVTETFDVSASRAPVVFKLMGLPKGHAGNVHDSVADLVAHFA